MSRRKKIGFSAQSGNRECSGILIDPQVHSSHGGVVVLHDSRGVTDSVANVASRISELTGFVTLVPELNHGQVNDNHEKLHKDLDIYRRLKDVEDAIDFLLSQGCSEVGLVGFSTGAALSLVAAAKLQKRVSASVAFYGMPNRNRYCCNTISIPIQIHYARNDTVVGLSSKQEIEQLQDDLSHTDVDVDFFDYDADHDFVDQSQSAYLPGATKLALDRCSEFLTKHLF